MSKAHFISINLLVFLLYFSLILPQSTQACQPCYTQNQNQNCPTKNKSNITSHTLHMSVHPHLDAFWIFDFDNYYSPQSDNYPLMNYFASNRFSSVKQIFDTITEVLIKSQQLRQIHNKTTQNAYRSFFNSQLGFFKKWYSQLPKDKKLQVKSLLATKYWQIVNGAYVQHDQGCAYYDDIIENFQNGLRFLKSQFNYYPKIAISADSFGHSQSTVAILAHLGIQGFFVQRSDQHILLTNKTQFIWKSKSSNGNIYGAIPTHIRWAIHGFQDQFMNSYNPNQIICEQKQFYINNLRRQNQFLKQLTKSNHIMRYFGHDFQQFDNYSYTVIQQFMSQFSIQKCNKVLALYGNPTEYFKIMMSQVFNKIKPLAFRQEDIMPIWDYDSGLYWTGYYTTDPFHKKYYRDAGRYLTAARKVFTPFYLADPNSQLHKNSYKLLQQFAQTVSYLQHHDGISGTSRYQIMDKYQKLAENHIQQLKQQIFQQMFQLQFPTNTNNPIFYCSLDNQCSLPQQVITNDIYLKIFKTGTQRLHQPIIIHLQQNQFFQPDCPYQINCLCPQMPCTCDLYLYPTLQTYNLIKLKKFSTVPKPPNFLHQIPTTSNPNFTYNTTHITLTYNNNQYSITYKKLNGDQTSRYYQHLSRFKQKMSKGFSIRSGKYALGNNINTEEPLSQIKKILQLQQPHLTKYLIIWRREQLKTMLTIPKIKQNQWKLQTISSAQSGKLQDLYLEIYSPNINNNHTFYTDSNGWLVMKRSLFLHQDYQPYFSKEKYDDINGNTYPMTAFVYIQDVTNKSKKISINTDRPQGTISYKPGTIWINFDRLTADDGKWVDQTTHRTQYQKYVHYITVDNIQNNQRILQKSYDQPLIIQGNSISQNQRVQQYQPNPIRQSWQNKVNLNSVKFHIRPYNDSTLLLRIQNNKDYQNTTIQLFSQPNKTSTFLTAFFGHTIKFDQIYQTNLAGNMKYQQFLSNKWNWNTVVNLSKSNYIFNKNFSQIITLRPLEIRTFVFVNINIDTQLCINIQQLKYSHNQIIYRINQSKPMPTRTQLQVKNQKIIINYLLNQDHCNNLSPVKFLQQNTTNTTTNTTPAKQIQIITQTTPQQPQPITTQKPKINPHTPNVPFWPLLNQTVPQKPTPPIIYPPPPPYIPNTPATNPLPPKPTTSFPPHTTPTPPSQLSQTKNLDFKRIQSLVLQSKPLKRQQKISYFQNMTKKLNKLIQTNNNLAN